MDYDKEIKALRNTIDLIIKADKAKLKSLHREIDRLKSRVIKLEKNKK